MKYASLREKVDAIDDQILRDLAARVKVCRAIGDFKKQAEHTYTRCSQRERSV